MIKWNLKLFCWLVFALIVFIHKNSCGPSEKRLLRYLFNQDRNDAHNILERPSGNDSKPLEVFLKIFLTQIIDVDEKNQILQTNVWMDLTWTDYHFVWNPILYNNVTSLILPASKIWRPDVLLYNSADERFDATFPVNAIASYTGLMHNVPPGMFKSTCKIGIKWYPFDTQSCRMKFGSWTHEGNLIDLKFPCNKSNPASCNAIFGEGNIDNLMENGEWDVLSFKARRNIITYKCCPEKFIDITYTLEIKRRTLYYTFNLIVPCIIISTMALLGFLIPPDAGEKISLGVTILLSLTVFLMMVAEKMPPTSEAIPLIGMYFTCVMIVCSLSLVFTVLVLNFHHRSTDSIEVPYLLKLVVNVWLARMLFMKPRNRISSTEHLPTSPNNSNTHSRLWPPPNGSPNSMATQQHHSYNTIHACKRNAAICNRAFQANSVKGSRSLLANVLDLESEIWARATASTRVSPPLLPNIDTQNQQQATGVGGTPPPPSYEPESGTPPGDGVPQNPSQIREILGHLRRVTKKLAETEQQEVRANEWKFTARVMDRFCLVIFTIIIIISSTTILMQDVLNSRPIPKLK